MTDTDKTGYKPDWLLLWAHPDNYLGQTWYDYYGAGVGKSRDSGALDRSNFRAMLNALGFDDDECVSDDCPVIDDEPSRTIVRENHWAVGWVEWIAIHESDIEGLKIADQIMEKFQNYCIIDESIYFEIEDEDCEQTWTNCYNIKERLEYLREHLSNSCIKGSFRELREACRGCWYSASNLLPCPGDLLN